VVINRQGSIAVVDEKNRERERLLRIYGRETEKSTKAISCSKGKVMVDGILTISPSYRNRRHAHQGLAGRPSHCTKSGRGYRNCRRARRGGFADEKRQPAIVVKGQGSKRYLNASRAPPHGAVVADTVFPG